MQCILCHNADLYCKNKVDLSKLKRLWNKSYFQNETVDFFDNCKELSLYECKMCSLGFYHPFIMGDDKFYNKLSSNQWYYSHEDKTEYTYANTFLKDNNNLLDVGCGIGRFKEYITAKNVRFTGLELNTKAISEAKEKGLNVINCRIEDFCKNNKEEFDVVTTFQVLEHISNIESYVKSMIDCLKINGLLIIAVPNNESFISIARNNVLNMPPHHVLLWNKQSLTYLANKYNMDILHILEETVSNIHKKWYYHTIVYKNLKKLLGQNVNILSFNFFDRVLSKISSGLSLVLSFFNIKTHLKHKGQNIIIVMRKK